MATDMLGLRLSHEEGATLRRLAAAQGVPYSHLLAAAARRLLREAEALQGK